MNLSEYLSEAVAKRKTGKYDTRIEFRTNMMLYQAEQMLESCGFERYGSPDPDDITSEDIKKMVMSGGLKFCISTNTMFPYYDLEISVGDGEYLYEMCFFRSNNKMYNGFATVYVWKKSNHCFNEVGQETKEWLSDTLNREIGVLTEAVAKRATGKYKDKLIVKGEPNTFSDTVNRLILAGAEWLVTGNVDIGKRSYATHTLTKEYSENTDPDKLYYTTIRKYGERAIMVVARARYKGGDPEWRSVGFLVFDNDDMELKEVLILAYKYDIDNSLGTQPKVYLEHGTNEDPMDIIDEINELLK